VSLGESTHGNTINFTGLLQSGETKARMKNHHVDILHVCKGSNESATLMMYETSEIRLAWICWGRLWKVLDC